MQRQRRKEKGPFLVSVHCTLREENKFWCSTNMSRFALLVICFLVLITFITAIPVEHELVEENLANRDLERGVVRAPTLDG